MSVFKKFYKYKGVEVETKSYYYEFQVDGIRHTGNTHAKTKRDADAFEALKKVEVSADKSKSTDIAALPASLHIDAYIIKLQKDNKSETYIRKSKQILTDFFSEVNTLKQLTSLSFDKYILMLRQVRKLSQGSIVYYAIIIKSFINWRVKKASPQILTINPIQNCGIGKVRERDKTFSRVALPHDEMIKLMNGCVEATKTYLAEKFKMTSGMIFNKMIRQAENRSVLIRFLYETGARRQDAIKMTWNDIKYNQVNKKHYTEFCGKNDEGNNIQYMSVELIDALKVERERQDKYNHSKVKDTEKVFIIHSRTAEYLKRDVATLKINLGDKKVFDLHAHRKTLGTNLMESGVMPQIVKEILRHKQIETTLNYYADVNDRMLIAANDKLFTKAKKQIPTETPQTTKQKSS